MKNSISMMRFTAELADCLEICRPIEAEEAFGLVKQLMHTRGMEKAEKLLIYNPDAIGMWLYQKYTQQFAPVLRHTQLGVPVCTVLPSVTPVCFGTMYTGLSPQQHGIMKYEKQLIKRMSLFDCLEKSGKKTAIVAVENSSMAVIFGERNISYYILPYDQDVNKKAQELIGESDYEVIVVYNQEYDDVMHRTFPESAEALNAMNHHIAAFAKLCETAERAWAGYDSLVCWATDHGIHTAENGHGTHGYDVEEDLNVMHFFGAYPKAEA